MVPFQKFVIKFISVVSPSNEECNAAKWKENCSCFLGTAEICQLFFIWEKKWGNGKLTLPFSAKRLRISAPRSPTRWLYPLKPGGEQKSADVQWKTVTLIYPDLKKCHNQ
jgi:hypothetical protein